jgi:hypothetical protein
MAELIWDFNDFMNRKFDTLAFGLTPSGELHLGFLATLACAFMYLKEHPESNLIITNVENSLSSDIAKYGYYPLRYQSLEEGKLTVPSKTSGRVKPVTTTIHASLTGLIWKLVQAFDTKTAMEIKKIKKAANIPKVHRQMLEIKENKIYHMFGTHVYIYSFMNVLRKNRQFVNQIVNLIQDFEFAQIAGGLCGMRHVTSKKWGPKYKVMKGGKESTQQAKAHPIPIRLFCPDCNKLCPNWASVVTSCPIKTFPKVALAAQCRNFPQCKRARLEEGSYGLPGWIIKDAKMDLHETEFYFMLAPTRDFFSPFLADCHVFGGDYFQLPCDRYGTTGIDKIKVVFDYLEQKTGQKKFLFGGPLILMGGKKMSKSEESFNLRDLPKITTAFLKIVEYLESMRGESFPEGLRLEYSEIIKLA